MIGFDWSNPYTRFFTGFAVPATIILSIVIGNRMGWLQVWSNELYDQWFGDKYGAGLTIGYTAIFMAICFMAGLFAWNKCDIKKTTRTTETSYEKVQQKLIERILGIKI